MTREIGSLMLHTVIDKIKIIARKIIWHHPAEEAPALTTRISGPVNIINSLYNDHLKMAIID